jgi:hypothetical protein
MQRRSERARLCLQLIQIPNVAAHATQDTIFSSFLEEKKRSEEDRDGLAICHELALVSLGRGFSFFFFGFSEVSCRNLQIENIDIHSFLHRLVICQRAVPVHASERSWKTYHPRR